MKYLKLPFTRRYAVYSLTLLATAVLLVLTVTSSADFAYGLIVAFALSVLVVPDKAQRVYNFHRSTLAALAEVVAAAGLPHPNELLPRHFLKRVSPDIVATYEQIHRFLKPGELLNGTDDPRFAQSWAMARADSFTPAAA